MVAGGVVFGVYLLTTLVLKPLYNNQARIDTEIESKIQFIEKYYEILNQKPYYEAKSRENQSAHKALASRFLSEKKPGLAAASMQRMLEGFAAKSSVSIERVRVEKHKFTESMMTIPVEMTVRANLNNLSQFIYQIENHEKFLVIESMKTRRINKSDPEVLEAILLISGFILEGEPEGTKRT